MYIYFSVFPSKLLKLSRYAMTLIFFLFLKTIKFQLTLLYLQHENLRRKAFTQAL